MYTQVLQIGLTQHGAHGVGHTADPQLQAGAVGNLLNDQLGHRLIHIRCRVGGLDPHGVIAAFHDHIHFADMDALIKAAQTAGHICIDLHNNDLRLIANSTNVGGGKTEVKVTVAVHRRHLEHGHIRRCDMVGIVAGQLAVAHRLMEACAGGNVLALHTAHMVGIENNMTDGVLNVENSGLPQADTAAYLHILQFRGTARQRFVQYAGMDGAKAVVHPVAGSNHLHRLIGSDQLLLIHLLKIRKSHDMLLLV